MPTSAEGSSGLNCKVYYGNNGSPLTYTEIPKVFDIGELGGGVPDRVELTHHGITDFRRRYVRSFSDPGTVTISANYLPGSTEHQQLIADDIAGTERDFKVEFPTDPDDNVTFTATVSVRTEQPMEDRLALIIELTVTSGYTFSFA